MQFCKEFNEKTSTIRPDVPMKVVVVAFADRTFKFFLKPPETSWFLKKATGMTIFLMIGKETFTNYPGHIEYDMVSL